MKNLKETIKKLIKKELEEISTTGAVSGYLTPYAFSSRKKGDPKKDMGNLKSAQMFGYQKVDEKKKQSKPKVVPVGKETSPDVVNTPKQPRSINKDDLYILKKRRAVAHSNNDSKSVDHYDALIAAAERSLRKSSK